MWASAIFLFAVAAIFSQLTASAEESVCAHSVRVIVRGNTPIELSETEKYLVCGDTGTEEPYRSAWKTVPRTQAQFFLRRFLANRGYYHPRITLTQEGGILVEAGGVTTVRAIVVRDGPAALEFERRRGFLGRALTPELLDELEQWIINRLQTVGYPCPQLNTRADPDTGEVFVDVRAGPFRQFDGVIAESVPEIKDTALRRFDAFRFKDPFNVDLLRLTAERTMVDGTLLSTYFEAICSPPDASATARQSVVPGLPHILRFGFGANTEGLVLGRASWRNTRVGPMASVFEVSAFASTKEQRLNSAFSWYFDPAAPRNYLEPSVEMRRRNEEPFESLSTRFQLAPGTSWEDRGNRYQLEAGPVWDFIKTLRGTGPTRSRLLSLEARGWIQSHYFEFYRASPRAGFFSQFTAMFNDQAFLSDVTAQRLNWDGEALLNWRNFDPPLLISGLRWKLRTTFSDQALAPGSQLPLNFRHFIGGISDLRGFGRSELPSNQLGALTLAYAGLEFRLASVLPAGMEPLVFLDLGMLGRESIRLEAPLYWSPGLGMRWGTPFGSVRATLAHGFLSSDEPQSPETSERLSHWQFYFSFGEEF